MKVTVSKDNSVGKVFFNKVVKYAEAGLMLSDITDVDVCDRVDGALLAYDETTNTYRFITEIDCGRY